MPKSGEFFLCFLDPPPSGYDFLTEAENTSVSSSHHLTSSGEHCSRHRDGKRDEEEEEEERERRLLGRDSCDVLDLSHPKVR